MVQPLSIAGEQLDDYFHICAFFDSRDQEYEVLGPFFKEGIDQGEKELHIVDPAFADDHRARLRGQGIDVAHCELCRQLNVLPWQDAYLRDGRFDKDHMLATVDHLTGEGLEAGYKRLRIMGNMSWVFKEVPGSEQIIEYEAEVNEVLSRNRQPAVCVYDVSQLSGAMMMDLLRTHPLTLVGGVLQENPYYVPPSQMLEELAARKNLRPTQAA